MGAGSMQGVIVVVVLLLAPLATAQVTECGAHDPTCLSVISYNTYMRYVIHYY